MECRKLEETDHTLTEKVKCDEDNGDQQIESSEINITADNDNDLGHNSNNLTLTAGNLHESTNDFTYYTTADDYDEEYNYNNNFNFNHIDTVDEVCTNDNVSKKNTPHYPADWLPKKVIRLFDLVVPPTRNGNSSTPPACSVQPAGKPSKNKNSIKKTKKLVFSVAGISKPKLKVKKSGSNSKRSFGRSKLNDTSNPRSENLNPDYSGYSAEPTFISGSSSKHSFGRFKLNDISNPRSENFNPDYSGYSAEPTFISLNSFIDQPCTSSALSSGLTEDSLMLPSQQGNVDETVMCSSPKPVVFAVDGLVFGSSIDVVQSDVSIDLFKNSDMHTLETHPTESVGDKTTVEFDVAADSHESAVAMDLIESDAVATNVIQSPVNTFEYFDVELNVGSYESVVATDLLESTVDLVSVNNVDQPQADAAINTSESDEDSLESVIYID